MCSGIEAVTCAWYEFATPLWFSEIDAYPSAVLAHHYSEVPNHGDMYGLTTKIISSEIPAPDVLVGGTPCQAFSVAGHRRSLDDARGNLTLELINLLEAIDGKRNEEGNPPTILLWENVPGVLSTKDNAFGCFLAGLAGELEPLHPPGARWQNAGMVVGPKRSIAWRVLDAQYFGVAQRRKRVYLVASARRERVLEVLLELKSMPRDSKTGRSTRQDITAYANSSFGGYRETVIGETLTAKGGGCCGGGSETLVVLNDQGGSQMTVETNGKVGTLRAESHGHLPIVAHGRENIIFEIRGDEVARTTNKDVSPTLTARMGTAGHAVPCVALAGNTIGRQPHNGGNGNGYDDSGVSYTLTSTDVHGVAYEHKVRKLTPVECERLMGFPDNYTLVPYRGKPAEQCADTPRYKALGNSMVVPVMKWIGKRIADRI